MNKQEIIDAKKTLAENITIAHTAEYFVVAIAPDNVLALTPQHAKRIHQYLESEIGNFEKTHGKIDAKWDSRIKSPYNVEK